MHRYFVLLLSIVPMLINSENCTVLWNVDNFNTRMKIKMCIEPIEQSFVVPGEIDFNNLSKLVNISNNETFLKNESIANISSSPSSMKNESIANISSSPSTMKNSNTSMKNLNNTPSPSDEGGVETVIAPVVPSPTVVDSPSAYIRGKSTINIETPSTSDVNETLLKKNQSTTDINKFDTTAFVSILSISLIAISGLLVYIIKKRKRQNVQPLCKFNKSKKRSKSLERPKDYIIEHMVKNPIIESKEEEKKDEEKKDEEKKEEEKKEEEKKKIKKTPLMLV